MDVRTVLSNLRKNYKNIIWWRDLFLRKLIFPLLFRHNNGIYILQEAWDSLIILDACRYDVFEEIYRQRKMKGTLEYRISRGTDTISFLLENFGDKRFNSKCKEIVYVTANPFVNKYLKGKFHKIISVWNFGWDEELGVVPPESVYEAALKAVRKYKGKRFIIHFMQPHYPYITAPEIADDSLKELREAVLQGRKICPKPIKRHILKISQSNFYLTIDKEIHFKAYKENLRLAMPYVEKLIDILPGKTVVTADHGEAFGETLCSFKLIKIYGHPAQVRIPVLTKVPWLIIKPEEKKKRNLEKELARIRARRIRRYKVIR